MFSFIPQPLLFSQPSSSHIWAFILPPIIIPKPSSRALQTTTLMFSNFKMFSSLRTPSQFIYTLPTSHSNFGHSVLFLQGIHLPSCLSFPHIKSLFNDDTCTTRPPFSPLPICSKPWITITHFHRVQNGSPGSTRFYGPVHLRRYWSVPVSTGPYILGRPVKF